jgi:transient receptor potential cation channel subfamily M protein 3
MWNVSDAAAIIVYCLAFSLRLQPSTMYISHFIFCFNIIYWHIRILNILAVNKYFGPLVTMAGKMMQNTIQFLFILFVVLLSYASCHQSIIHADIDPNWSFAQEMIFKPYFMLYGEIFGEDIFPSCDEDVPLVDCHVGPWISFIQTAIYLFVTNVLLINLLIAVHNHTFDELNAVSHEVWMFHRFRGVMEYEKKPVLPPPLSLLCHVFFLFKYCYHKVRGIQESYDSALKIFLDRDALIHLNYFEEECMDSYFKEQEAMSQRSTDECMRNTDDKVNRLYQKIKDINQERNNLSSDIQEVEVDIRKLTDLSSQMLSDSAAIYQIMQANVH